MPLDPTALVFSVAVTIALGYVGHRVFEATRITDVLALVAAAGGSVPLGPTGFPAAGALREASASSDPPEHP